MTKQNERDAIEAFKRTRQPQHANVTRKITTKSVAGLSEIAAVAGMKPGAFVNHETFWDRVNDIQRNIRRSVEMSEA